MSGLDYDPGKRPLTVITESGDEWIATRMESSDRVDGLYEHRVWFMARKLDPQKQLGTGISVTYRPEMASSKSKERCFHGICVEIRKTGVLQSRGYDQYCAVLVPWFWLLQHRTHCRVFQQQKASEIIKTLAGEHSFSGQLDLAASGDKAREYCVQFNETDLDFITRLMNEEGWHYHFQQKKGDHTLTIGNDNGCFAKVDESDIEYFAESTRREWAITDWQHNYSLGAGSVQTGDYSYELAEAMPGNKVNSSLGIKAQKSLQHYFYPGRYSEKSAGTDIATNAIEGFDSRSSQVEGGSSLSGFYAGGCFKLESHPEASEKGEYLLLEVVHEFSAEETGNELHYRNRFRCIPADVDYRPLPHFEKPKILGLQSALVTGPSSEEIHMDDYNRIKVQFHWDTEGKGDDSSSCWVRVAQHMAGNSFGIQFVPRVGDEVLVSFLDSDPDRPLIVGSVYNETHKPPYETPTSYGMKLQSSPKGGADTFNELRFDCKKDEEQIFMQAEKDLVIEVKNDRNETIIGNLTEEIQKIVTRTVKEDDNLTVEGEQKITVTKNITAATDADYELTTKGNYTQNTDGDLATTVKGKTAVDSTGDIALESKGNINSKATNTITLDGASIKETGKQAIDLEVGASKISLSPSGIELSCGPSTIKLSASGVEISGMQFKAEGQVQAELKSGVACTVEGTVKTDIKGTMVGIQGNAMTQVKAGAMVEIQGAIAKIN
ncbi:type VI secretion system tip protein VgrG [Sansalvadorimonas sp. 2012CJ34-2]|uniref:Type VI secretion system tip protein VgrG n=1 Tax=Parendozoicomonas callyspongiae TaxID=2942213 RepID=A0ABT0PJ93_9GAMM|nr:type VI secretion system tip protein TssI/VgrG [Sansalvadorimonas sp. 2012CJ34-2]MCL6271449.1 type VI secretion system tip protein VgrG [Sansalvadorimonas sp. 2012CJ34-2]